MNRLTISFLLLGASTVAAQTSGNLDLSWNTIDGGGGHSTGGNYELRGTIGQPDAGSASGGSILCIGGFWVAGGGGPLPCYANCDSSTVQPILNVADFSCFLSRFAAGDPYANCDGSTVQPVLNVADFSCFLSKFAAGCP